MFKKIMSKIKDSKGVSVTTEIVIIIVIIVGIATGVGSGLTNVFTSEDKDNPGVVTQLGKFIGDEFTKTTEAQTGDVGE